MVYAAQVTMDSTAGAPWLSLLVALPLVFALLLWLVRPLRSAGREVALMVSVAVLAGVLVMMFTGYDFSATDGVFQLGENYRWIKASGLSWALGVNGLGLVMIILATALTPLVLLASWNEGEDADSRAGYAAHILALEAFMILLFAARDLLLFYIAFEGMLVPLYFLVGRYGHGDAARRRHAAIKFVLYSLAGGLVMLFGVIGVYVYGPGATGAADAFHLDRLTADGALDAGNMGFFLMLTFLIAFAIKAPMVPGHTWLPSTAKGARGGTSTLLVGVLDKVGTWGMIVICWPIFPHESAKVAPVIIVLALVSILWGALAAIAQKDLMRLVSFTSISHFGYMVMALPRFAVRHRRCHALHGGARCLYRGAVLVGGLAHRKGPHPKHRRLPWFPARHPGSGWFVPGFGLGGHRPARPVGIPAGVHDLDGYFPDEPG